MTHIFILQANNDTLIIHGIDVQNDLIEYEIRNQEIVVVPRHKAGAVILQDRIAFDDVQLPMPLFRKIFDDLYSDVNAKAELRPQPSDSTGNS